MSVIHRRSAIARTLACLLAGAGLWAPACSKPAEAPRKADAATKGWSALADHESGGRPGPALPPPPLNYNRDVRPILSDKCFQCHGPDDKKRDSGLRLDQFAAATHPNAKSGHIPIVPGKPEASEAWRRITTHDEDELMPPKKSGKSVTEAEKALLKRWMAEGAKYETHWSFTPIAAQEVPDTRDKAWVRNEVDAFILARLEQEGIAPSPEMDKARLLRRVALDLTGLPPTPEEVSSFLADGSPDAYEKQVDRLFASACYGEHMAMGWMDAARYGDTDGFQYDRTRTMWPWRDWVAQAYNKDLPFNDFVTWQIAGDLVPNATPEQILASGFNRNHMLNNEGGRDAKENRVDYVVERTVVTGTVFLGLTLDCARCHDHKFDPIATKDVYALSAFFNQVDEDGAVKSWGPRYAFDTGPYGRQTVLVMRDLPREKRRKTFVLTRGEWDRHGEEVEAGTPAVLTPSATGARVSPPAAAAAVEKTAGGGGRDPVAPAVTPPAKQQNRLDLAKWLVAPENPLLTRVEANRQWQRFFGHGLSRTPDDFGLQGEYPSHPELLDFLAHRLKTQWSIKKLQRLIVTSAAYRQSSRVRTDLAERDPQNRLLARQARFRLPADVLRDQALAVSGLLNGQVGGPPVFPYQPPGLWEELVADGSIHFKQSKGDALYRRSLYIFWRRLIAPVSLFDTSNRQSCRVRPVRTNTPLQALALMNDPVYAEAARVLAERTLSKGADAPPEAQVGAVFLRALLREPKPAELAPLVAGLGQAKAWYAAHPEDAEALIKVGEHPLPPGLDAAKRADIAALANVCGVILNLDETLTRE